MNTFLYCAVNFDISPLNSPIDTQSRVVTNETKFSIPSMTMHDILNFVAMLDQNKATTVLNGISANYTKSSILSIAPVVLRICNMSTALNMVFFLTCARKQIKLIPIYEAGIQTERHNYYRPISILLILSKLLERHVANSYVKFLTESNSPSNCGHGFRAHHSCESTLILVYEQRPSNTEQDSINGI